MLGPDPLVAMTISLEVSINLYYIRLPSISEPPEVEYYHIELPAVSSKVTVLRPLKFENEYKKDSFRPNINPL